MESTTPDDKLVTLAIFAGEIEATLIANEFNNLGIPAQASGILTAGFRAEAPGSVKVLVHEKNLAQAQQILEDYTASRQDIDWNQINVGEMEDGDSASDLM